MSSIRTSIRLGCACLGLANSGLSAQDPLDGMRESDWAFANRPPPAIAGAQESSSDAGSWDWARPDARAPAGVVFTDTLDVDEWMIHLRYQRIEQEGLRDGTDDIPDSEIFAFGYSTAPQEMTTDILDFLVLYGLGDSWTLFAEMPWISRDMENLTDGGVGFSTEADGIGDVQLGTLLELLEEDGSRLIANLGLSVPTGSTDEDDADENGASRMLPYSMQLGTGTYDLHPGLSWLVQYDTWAWGAQGQFRVRIGRNDEDWARSNEGDLSAWVIKGFSPTVAGSLRVRGYFWGDVYGEAGELDPNANPLEDPSAQGGERYDLVGGLTWQPGGGYETIRTLDLEGGKPVTEWLDGPGLSTDVYLIVSWRYSF